MTEELVLIAALVIIIVYLLLGYRLRLGMQPIRLEVAEAANRLMSAGAMNNDDKKFINYLLDNLFSTSLAVLIVVLYPISFLWSHERKVNASYERTGLDMGPEIRDLQRKIIICIVTNSPITAVLFTIEVFLFGVLFPLKNAMSSAALSATKVKRGFQDHLRHQH